jgi:hypothetical protein
MTPERSACLIAHARACANAVELESFRAAMRENCEQPDTELARVIRDRAALIARQENGK